MAMAGGSSSVTQKGNFREMVRGLLHSAFPPDNPAPGGVSSNLMGVRQLNVDKRSIDRAWKEMDRVIKLCQHPRMNLKNSPPFILDILPDIHKHVSKVN